jgi:hypothetical protein
MDNDDLQTASERALVVDRLRNCIVDPKHGYFGLNGILIGGPLIEDVARHSPPSPAGFCCPEPAPLVMHQDGPTQMPKRPVQAAGDLAHWRVFALIAALASGSGLLFDPDNFRRR